MKKNLFLLFILTMIALPAISVIAEPARKAHHTWRDDLLALHNQHRAKANAAPLVRNKLLAIAAQKHSLHMAKTGQFDHEGIGDGTIKSRIEATGYDWGRIGENILWGAKDINQAMKSWVESPPHFENVIRPEYTEIGFGYAKADDGKQYWTACFGAPLKPVDGNDGGTE